MQSYRPCVVDKHRIVVAVAAVVADEPGANADGETGGVARTPDCWGIHRPAGVGADIVPAGSGFVGETEPGRPDQLAAGLVSLVRHCQCVASLAHQGPSAQNSLQIPPVRLHHWTGQQWLWLEPWTEHHAVQAYFPHHQFDPKSAVHLIQVSLAWFGLIAQVVAEGLLGRPAGFVCSHQSALELVGCS